MVLYLEIISKVIGGQVRGGLEYQTELGPQAISQWCVAREVLYLELYTGEHKSNVIRKEEAFSLGSRLEAVETEDLEVCSYAIVGEY